MKDWRNELDALVSETMAFVKAVTPEVTVSVNPFDDPKTAPTIAPHVPENADVSHQESALGSAAEEREEIRQRLASFKAHQLRWIREREEFAQSTLSKAKAQQRDK